MSVCRISVNQQTVSYKGQYVKKRPDAIISGSMGGMMRFSDEAWQQNAALREAIHRLPFNTELAAGTLSRERFRFYIVQDAIYLGQYARVLTVGAAKAPEVGTLPALPHSRAGAG